MKNLSQLDRKYLWHPFTQGSEWEKEIYEYPMVISKAKGVYLYDSNGKKYIDGVSSLWANIHGHRHPALDAAIIKQLKKVAHTTFLGLTHEPGILLAQELIKIAPQGLTRVFYSDNGSTAVEVALKMAYQYRLQSGQLKIKSSKKISFLSLKESYHGDTIGSVSVGGIDLFHKKFYPLLFSTEFAMSPHCLKCPFRKSKDETLKITNYEYKGEKPKPGDFRSKTGCHWECLGQVESKLKQKKSKTVAAILEPLVQGAGGILTAPPGYLWGFARICKKYGVPLILDEVAVGFGRTGTLFACQQEGVTPDFLCLAKGITGGYLPLAATLTHEKIYQAFLGKYEEFKTFFHGHTYTANPLATQVAIASLDLFKKEKTLHRVQKLSRLLTKLLQELAHLPMIHQIRQTGLIAGIELTPSSLHPRIGKKVCLQARKHGLLLRPLGNTLVLIPPLSITEEELTHLIRGTHKSILGIDKK